MFVKKAYHHKLLQIIKYLLIISCCGVLPIMTWASDAGVDIDVVLSPAGSFTAKTKQITGTAKKTADGVTADGIVVDLRSLKTGIELRDSHTKKYLMVNKYPKAKLLQATGKKP